MDFVKNISFLIPYDGIVFISETPQKISWNNGRLHSVTEPAVKYDGDYGLYAINGVTFPRDLFEKLTQKKMSFKEILALVDVDQRNQAMRFVGDKERDKFLEHVKAEVIDEYTKTTLKGNPVYYKLYKIPKGEIFSEDIKAMWYTCPSTGMSNFSGVPKEMEKVDEAMSWKGSDDKHIISSKDWRDCLSLVDEA